MLEQIAVAAALGVTKEITKSNGFRELIDSLIEITCGDILLIGNLKKESRKAIEHFSKKILYESDKIEDSNFQNPIGHEQQVILLSALEIGKNYISSEHYRNLFSKLISSSFDKNKYGFLHPSFPFIIAQLTPLDCKILSDIEKKSKSYTMGMMYSYEINGETISDEFYDYYLILNESSDYEDPDLTNISINNLVKQGLIKLLPVNELSVSSINLGIDEEKFKTFTERHTTLKDTGIGGSAGGPSSKIVLTRLGLSFIKTCT